MSGSRRMPPFLLAPVIGGLLAPAICCLGSASATSSERPVPAISRVLLVSVDGLRPDLLLRADAPVMKGLLEHGSYSLWASGSF